MLTSTTHINNTRKSEAGFTLIELSIVLVIIGLIVGGILTGQDLIKAAEQRATLAQIEKYNTAVNTFRNKFGGVPGDLPAATASNFGLFTLTAAAPCATLGTVGCSDGNGLIDSPAGAGDTSLNGETVVFWDHLSTSNLIDGSFGGGATAGVVAGTITTGGALGGAVNATTAPISAYLPLAKLGRANYISAGEVSGINYFVISGFGSSSIAVTTAGVETNGSNNLSPLESYSMDKKVDDGLPLTGSVVALDAGTNQVLVAATTGYATLTNTTACLTVAATNAYLVTSSTPGCSLRFRFN